MHMDRPVRMGPVLGLGWRVATNLRKQPTT